MNVIEEYQEWEYSNLTKERPEKVLPNRDNQLAVYLEQIKRDFEQGIPAVARRGPWTWGGVQYQTGDKFGPVPEDVSRLVYADLLRPGSVAQAAKKFESASDYNRAELQPLVRLINDDSKRLSELKAKENALKAELTGIRTAIKDKTNRIKQHEENLAVALDDWNKKSG